MATLTTAFLAAEILEDALLTLDQITTVVTVIALITIRAPGQLPRFRLLLEDLLADIQNCESDLGDYAPLDA